MSCDISESLRQSIAQMDDDQLSTALKVARTINDVLFVKYLQLRGTEEEGNVEQQYNRSQAYLNAVIERMY